MKKRMFLTTVLMALVLLMAVATATFAWYQANTNNNVSVADQTQSITTSSDAVTVGALQVSVKFSDAALTDLGPVDSSGNVKFVNPSNQEVYSKPWNDESQTYYSTLGTVSWEVVATINGQAASAIDLAVYAGKQFTISFDGADLRITDVESTGYVAADKAITYTVKIDNTGKFVAVGTADKTSGTLYVSIVETYTTKGGALAIAADLEIVAQ